MKLFSKLLLLIPLILLLALVALNVWGALTLGVLKPDAAAITDPGANRVVMVFGATGSVGDGLLQAAVEDAGVDVIYIVTRRSSARIDAAVASGKAVLLLHQDFSDYRSLASMLGEVTTVLWGLGTSSLKVDDDNYTRIHVDFPVSFVSAWLAARRSAPMTFHYVTGMGTDANGSAHWAREKGRAEQELAALAAHSPLRTFSYRSAYIRPSAERASGLSYVGEFLLRPGKLVIGATELGQAMLEVSVRSNELPNGSLIDNGDSIAFARAYRVRLE